jgi:hypothetical protein
MFRSQGRHLDQAELERIVSLLRNSELTLSEIAARMQCSRSAIAAVNQRFQVRRYQGLRSEWELN